MDEGALDLALVVTRGEQRTPPATQLVPLLSEELVVISSADAGKWAAAGSVGPRILENQFMGFFQDQRIRDQRSSRSMPSALSRYFS